MGGFEEEGIWWEGTRGEYKMWIAYKRERALAFVKRGFSVGWYPDGSNWMDVFVPVRPHAGKAGYVASAMFFGKPSEYGIDGGAISKLTIRRHEESLESLLFGAHAETVFNYDRGDDIDHHSVGKRGASRTCLRRFLTAADQWRRLGMHCLSARGRDHAGAVIGATVPPLTPPSRAWHCGIRRPSRAAAARRCAPRPRPATP